MVLGKDVDKGVNYGLLPTLHNAAFLARSSRQLSECDDYVTVATPFHRRVVTTAT